MAMTAGRPRLRPKTGKGKVGAVAMSKFEWFTWQRFFSDVWRLIRPSRRVERAMAGGLDGLAPSKGVHHCLHTFKGHLPSPKRLPYRESQVKSNEIK